MMNEENISNAQPPVVTPKIPPSRQCKKSKRCKDEKFKRATTTEG